MSPPVRIVRPVLTERLVLRPFESNDLDALFDLQSRPEVARYLYWEPRTRRQTKAVLKRKVGWHGIEGEGDTINLAVTVRDGGGGGVDGGRVIGDVLLTYTSAVHQQAELGYMFHPDWHGHGYATEAAAALVGLAFGKLGVHRVMAHLDARNVRSARVLERLGMRREAHLVQNEWVKGEWTDDVVYAVLAEEWAGATGRESTDGTGSPASSTRRLGGR
jgi:RimJ/RimL family protein N-acetyltransferase